MEISDDLNYLEFYHVNKDEAEHLVLSKTQAELDELGKLSNDEIIKELGLSETNDLKYTRVCSKGNKKFVCPIITGIPVVFTQTKKIDPAKTIQDLDTQISFNGYFDHTTADIVFDVKISEDGLKWDLPNVCGSKGGMIGGGFCERPRGILENASGYIPKVAFTFIDIGVIDTHPVYKYLKYSYVYLGTADRTKIHGAKAVFLNGSAKLHHGVFYDNGYEETMYEKYANFVESEYVDKKYEEYLELKKKYDSTGIDTYNLYWSLSSDVYSRERFGRMYAFDARNMLHRRDEYHKLIKTKDEDEKMIDVIMNSFFENRPSIYSA